MSRRDAILASIRERARRAPRRVVLADGADPRAVAAARALVDEEICDVTLLGGAISLREAADEAGVSLDGIEAIAPTGSSRLDMYVDEHLEARRATGREIDRATARAEIETGPGFGAFLVRRGEADACVAGNLSTTADTVRAAIRVLGTAEGIRTVSSCFLMIGEERAFTFADCGVVPQPTADQLADIAISTARTHRSLTGEAPRVAMLSFSTKGSAAHALVDLVVEATRKARARSPGFPIDGELQLDAAIVPEVAARKAPDSPVDGKANVLVFPDLNSGNIGYKLAQRLARMTALGPLLQGVAAPMHDVSRGASAADLVDVAAIACAQAAEPA
ncbi:MAG: phosphate acetyltransferase [Gemmatimonadota bacterium]|nr:phosphate acetyltransferase [Gemmatimonadota bacterium]